MTWEIERHVMLADGETEVLVSVTIISPGEVSNGWDDPGSGPEIEITSVRLSRTEELMELTAAELERIEEKLCADPDLCDFLDEQPGDY